MPVGEVDLDPGGLRQPSMFDHFLALIISKRQMFLRLDPVERMAEARERRFGAGIIHPRQHRKQGSALHQGADCRTVVRLLMRALLVLRHQPLFHFRRALPNADHVRYLPTPVRAARPGLAFGMADTQPADHFRAQRAPRHGVDHGVDGFVRNPQRRSVGMHAGQCASNLLERASPLLR